MNLYGRRRLRFSLYDFNMETAAHHTPTMRSLFARFATKIGRKGTPGSPPLIRTVIWAQFVEESIAENSPDKQENSQKHHESQLRSGTILLCSSVNSTTRIVTSANEQTQEQCSTAARWAALASGNYTTGVWCIKFDKYVRLEHFF